MARALPAADDGDPSQPRRFALTDDQDRDSVNRWSLLGVKPITYERTSDHTALYQSVGRLVSYVRRDLIEWRREIVEIARGVPPVDPETVDLIDDALHDPVKVRFFANADSQDIDIDAQWLDWLIERGHIERILAASATADPNDPHRLIARWLASTYVHQLGNHLLQLLLRGQIPMTATLWTEIAYTIGGSKDGNCDNDLLNQWISYLTHHIPDGVFHSDLTLVELAKAADDAGLHGSLVSTFEASTRPAIALIPNAHEDTWHLKELWQCHLRPNLEVIAEQLYSLAIGRLEERHELQRIWHGATRDHSWDSISVENLVGVAREDDYRHISKVLVDAARESLLRLTEHRPDVARTKYEELIRAESPLVRRIAVHCAGSRVDVSPDQLIQWLFEHIGLVDGACREELRHSVALRYGAASPSVRSMVVSQLRVTLSQNDDEDGNELSYAYEKLRWLEQLRGEAPDCEITSEAYRELRTEHPELPSSVEIEEVPGTIVGYARVDSAWTGGDLLAKPAAEWVADLMAADESERTGIGVQGVAAQVAEAATQDFAWSLELADALIERECWWEGAWEGLWQAWQDDLEEEGFRAVLAWCRLPSLQGRYRQSICRMLESLVVRGGRPYKLSLIEEAQQLAEQVWTAVQQESGCLIDRDWLTAALNRAAGPLAEFWLGCLAAELQDERFERGQLPKRYSDAFGLMVADSTESCLMARAILMSRFSFLVSVDQDWCREHLLPQLTQMDSEDFQSAWDGLMYGSLTIPCVDLLMDTFQTVADHTDELRAKHTRERFVGHLASLLIGFVDDPLSEWLPTFLRASSHEDRGRFAWEVWRQLGGMGEGAQVQLWDRWLKRYWESRLDGAPIPLAGAEIDWMVNWTLHLDSLFTESTALAVRMPAGSSSPNVFFSRLADSGLVERKPNAATDLLLHVLTYAGAIHLQMDNGQLINALLKEGVTDEREDALCELQAKYGLAQHDST